MKRIVLVFFLILFLTGCDAEYRININEDGVDEKLFINNFENTKEVDFDNFYLPIDYDIDDYTYFISKEKGINYYDMDLDLKDKTLEFDYDHSFEEYSNSMLLNSCFNRVVFTRDDYEVLLSASEGFLCFDEFEDLNSIRVVIESDYKLIETNADSVNNHVYEWNIVDPDQDILLKLDSTVLDLSFLEKLMRGYYTNPFTVSLLILFIGFMVYMHIRGKNRKINKV